MSRKWNPFSKKKAHKTDSHGTTLANEEMFFQPTVRPGNKWCTTINPNSEQEINLHTQMYETAKDEKLKSGTTGATPTERALAETKSHNRFNYNESSTESQNQKNEQTKASNHPVPTKPPAVPEPPMLSAASVPRTSPRIARKLIKPGASANEQPSYLIPTTNGNMAVSINDEYTDPFDAVHQQIKTELSKADGYVEPYEAQQMYLEATQENHENSAFDSKKKMYDDPWDSAGPKKGNDYEEPWDNAETLPFSKRPQQFYPKPRGLIDKQMDLVRDRHGGGSHSGDSSTSSSSASIAKQRLVRVDSPRHSPKPSPRTSPKLDHRLIRPPDDGYPNIDPRLQLYSTPGAGPMKHRPVDHRLIKAEPSLDELRRCSPIANRTGSSKGSSRTSSPAGSSRVSPNHSPISTLVTNEPIHRLTSEQLRRSSSPLVAANISQFMLNKAKSRSLDIRNPQFLLQAKDKPHVMIPKSASDDQLLQAAAINNAMAYKPTHPLGGVREYDEPWDAGDPRESRGAAVASSVVHSRSRSYDLNYVPPMSYTKHGKSRSFDKQEVSPLTRTTDYEQPWDRREVPLTHLESMSRFQHRQLELHPSEAISRKDFDPFVALQKQNWFHGMITRDEANRRLAREVEGTYLVRNSESVPQNYSLSLRTRDDIIHMVISRTRDHLWILGEFSAPFHSVPEMIAFYATHRLKISDTVQLSLKYPLPEEYL